MTDDAGAGYLELDRLLVSAMTEAEVITDACGEDPLPYILKARAAAREQQAIAVTFYCMQAYGSASAHNQFATVAEALWPAMLLALDIKAAELGGVRAIPLTERELAALPKGAG